MSIALRTSVVGFICCWLSSVAVLRAEQSSETAAHTPQHPAYFSPLGSPHHAMHAGPIDPAVMWYPEVGNFHEPPAAPYAPARSTEEALSLEGEEFADQDPARPIVEIAYDELLFDQNQLTDRQPPGMLPGPPREALAEGECLDLAGETVKPWIRVKSTSLMGTWLPGSGDDFGLTDFSARVSLKSPRIPFLSLTPNYQVTFLNGPDQTDVPGTLHRASLTFMGFLPISKKWVGQAIVTPGIATDYDNMSSQAFRTTGMAFLIYMPSPQLQWMFGVIYLDREDVSLLPAAGLTWNPDERTRLELIFPRPRIMKKIYDYGDRSQWYYLAAEFGGGSWAVERTSGANDVVTLRDYRLLAGMEYKMPEDRSWYWEVGLVLGREIEYVSGIGDYRQDPTVILRTGITF